MHHVSYRGVFEMRASLKHLFSPCCRAETVPQTILYTRRDEEQKKTTTQYLIRITVQIQVHAHNESQLPNILVSVTTLLQCSVVYMGNFFFHVWMSKEERTKDVLCAQSWQLLPDLGNSFILNWFCFYTKVNYTLPECACCIWPQPMSLESKIIMPFVQNLDPFYCTSLSVQRMFALYMPL